MQLQQDHHVNTRFGIGRSGVQQMVEVAESRGLELLGFADRVNRQTDWLDEYVGEIRQMQRRTSVELITGVQAHILDQRGTLDVPESLRGVERVVITNRQFPGSLGPIAPKAVRAALKARDVTPRQVIESLIAATTAAVVRCEKPVIVGRLMGILPLLGLADPHEFTLYNPLIEAMLTHGAMLEVDEYYRSPSEVVARYFHDASVTLVAGTSSQRQHTVGRFRYVGAVARALS